MQQCGRTSRVARSANKTFRRPSPRKRRPSNRCLSSKPCDPTGFSLPWLALRHVLLVNSVKAHVVFTNEYRVVLKFAHLLLFVDMKELSSENINLKRLFEEETSSTEPILIIISPGTDPSQELVDLAKNTIGTDRYHQVCILHNFVIRDAIAYILCLLSGCHGSRSSGDRVAAVEAVRTGRRVAVFEEPALDVRQSALPAREGDQQLEAARQLPLVAHCRGASQVPHHPTPVQSQDHLRGKNITTANM